LSISSPPERIEGSIDESKTGTKGSMPFTEIKAIIQVKMNNVNPVIRFIALSIPTCSMY
jgi:hypothetical protein